jgi:hypothetical protein
MVWFCWLVVNQPQVGIRCTGAGCYSVAEACMRSILLMWIAEAAVVDENLERLEDASQR